MKAHDELNQVAEQLRTPEDGSSTFVTLATRNKKEGEIAILVVFRPSRRFEQMLSRELARSSRQCNIHCWKGLCESLPADFKSEKKRGTR